MKNDNDPRPRDYNPQQILKLARDLKERVNGFMQACWRNEETRGLADYNQAQSFGVSLDKTIESLQNLNHDSQTTEKTTGQAS